MRTPFFALPNILLREQAMPELVQDLRPASMAELLHGRMSVGAREDASALSARLARLLGPPGVADRAAGYVLSMMGPRGDCA
ncbi:MAG TPA: hypothetical protein DIU15_08055 [Deltaproteobacteria bacterium]|nr:hypothetical protein [Deltaproteobacteria bacterium]